jgi:hypothetical protein
MAEAGRGASESIECGHGARESDGLGVETLKALMVSMARVTEAGNLFVCVSRVITGNG